MRFGGEDVVRHKLVQRIVEAYDEHARGPERAPAAGAAGLSELDVELTGAAARPARRTRHRLRAARSRRALASAGRRATGTSRSQFVDAERIAELNREHRGKDEPTDVLSFPIDERRRRCRGPRELGDVVICRGAHRPTCARRSSTARCTCVGIDHETDDGEMLALQAEMLELADDCARASSRSPGGPTPASRRSSTRSSATRSRSSPTSRRPRAGRSAASRPATTGSSCSSTCRASSARATRSPSGCSAGSSASSPTADAALFVLNGEQGVGPGRPLHRRRCSPAPACRSSSRSTRSTALDRPRTMEALTDAAALGLGDDVFADLGPHGRRRRAELVDHLMRPDARRPVPVPSRRGLRPAARDVDRRAGPRAGAAAHVPGGPARGRGRCRGAR